MQRTTSVKLGALALGIGLAFSATAQEVERELEELDQQEEMMDEQRPTDYSNHDIAEVLSSEPHFSRFYEALQQTGLLEELESDGEYTVFVPFNEAFQRLPEGIWEAWMGGDGEDEFRDIIAYHIIEGAISAEDLSDTAQSFTTMSGKDVEIRSMYGAIMVEHVSVNQPDIGNRQGYIHGIDSIVADTTSLETEPVEIEEPEEEAEEAENGDTEQQNGAQDPID